MGKCVCGKTIDPKYSCTIDYKPVCKQCFDKAQEDHAAETKCIKPMLRLHELTSEQYEQWRETRAKVGRKKYGDKHLQRYGAVDVMEELLDAENILNLIYDRVRRGNIGMSDMNSVVTELLRFRTQLTQLQVQLLELDEYLDDAECTDEQGGNRIWWGEQSKEVES